MPNDLLSSKVYDDSALMATLQSEANSYCIVNGITMISADNVNAVHAPISLLPRPIKKEALDYCFALAPVLNKLYDRVARDYDFLISTLRPVAEHDDFVKTLLQILEASLAHGRSRDKAGMFQPLSLFIARSDYMIDEKEDPTTGTIISQAKQVEMNMIAAAFAGLSSKITGLHHYLLKTHLDRAATPENRVNGAPYGYSASAIPENRALDRLVAGLAHATEEFRSRHWSLVKDASATPHVIMVVQQGERNSPDQRAIEYALFSRGIPLIRASLDDLLQSASVHDDILYVNDTPVAVCYFRACYTPQDITCPAHVQLLTTLECSLAVKCPSIAHHLSGTKKVQQMLADRGVVRSYLDSDAEADELMKLFVGIHALDRDDDVTAKLIEETRSRPDDFVLKPQREGGGNNVWGSRIHEILSSSSAEERGVYVLMERIRPAVYPQALVRGGKVEVGPALSELGVYATFLGDGETALRNEYAGQLLRTKLEGVDEGGVNTGYSVLDSFIAL